MKITAITRYKHGELYAILRRIGWTQAELARQANLAATTIGHIINLIKRPTPEQADAIQKAVGTAGEYLDVLSEWPETFEGLQPGYRHEQTAEVPLERLIDHPEVLQLAAPETLENDHMEEGLEAILGELSPKEQIVIRERFWTGKSLSEIGHQINRTPQSVSLITKRALRRLRHHSRLSKLTGRVVDIEPPTSHSADTGH